MAVEDEGNSDACNLCQTPQSSALNMTDQPYLLSECGHLFCAHCIQKKEKRNFACPRCSFPVKIHALTTKTQDEYEVERDIRVRKKIRAIFNKTESDFTDVNAFKAYEEEVEDLVFNLVHGIAVDEANATVERYLRENEAQVIRNQALLVDADTRMRALLQEERSRQEQTHRQHLEEGMLAKRQRHLQSLIDNADLLGERHDPALQLSRLMGGVVGASAGAGQDEASASQQPSAAATPFALLVAQRKEPKLIVLSRAPGKPDSSLAGGYSRSDLALRNWDEIAAELARHSATSC